MKKTVYLFVIFSFALLVSIPSLKMGTMAFAHHDQASSQKPRLFSSEQLNDELKLLIAFAIDKFAQSWETEELGSIWIVNYVSIDDGTGYIVEGRPEDYGFEVVAHDESKTTVEVNFPCGSEYDESELTGQCSVNVLKKNGVWLSEVSSCSCGGY